MPSQVHCTQCVGHICAAWSGLAVQSVPAAMCSAEKCRAVVGPFSRLRLLGLVPSLPKEVSVLCSKQDALDSVTRRHVAGQLAQLALLVLLHGANGLGTLGCGFHSTGMRDQRSTGRQLRAEVRTKPTCALRRCSSGSCCSCVASASAPAWLRMRSKMRSAIAAFGCLPPPVGGQVPPGTQRPCSKMWC